MEIKKYKLTDICDFQGGSQPPKKEWSKSMKEGYVRMLQIRDFTQSHKDNVEYVKVSKSIKTCKSDDIMIGRYGASVGKILTGLEGAYNVAIMKTIPNEKVLSKKYLLALLKAPLFQNFILSVGVRAAQAGFNKDDLSKFYVFLPSLDNQKRIAKVLANCEKLIQKRKESITLLEEFLKSTFLDMFGDPVSNEKEWDLRTIEDLVTKSKGSIKRGPFGGALKKEIFVNEGYLVYEQYHALNNDFSFARYFINNKKFAKLKSFAVKPGDIIISCSGVNLGKLAIIPEGAKEGIINQALLKLTIEQKIMTNEMFVMIFTNENFKRKFFGDIRGSGVPNFPPISTFKKFQFICPPIEKQLKFNQILEQTKTLLEQAFLSKDELDNLYGSLSQAAFKGELDLSKVDISQLEESFNTENSYEEIKNKMKVEPVTLEKLEQIIKSRFDYQEFSISQIEEILNEQGIDYNKSLVKGFIKDLLSEEKIRTEYSGSTHQVIFKYNK